MTLARSDAFFYRKYQHSRRKLFTVFDTNRGVSHAFNYFSELLLCKMNVLGIFNMVDFLKIFFVSRSTKIS